jgi:putative peptidoglycan lipid II flippase
VTESTLTGPARAPSSGPNRLVHDNLVVAAGTALSRLTGFARLALFGVIFGRTALWDAYNAANGTPNMIYELVLGGVLSATLVPIFTRLFADDDDEAVSAVFSTTLLAVGALTVLAVVGAPLIFNLTALNVSDDVNPDDYRWLGTALARIFLVQIFFYGLAALWGAMLNARKRFFAPAWAPILSNVVIIVSLVLADRQLGPDENGFGAALGNAGFRNTLTLGATLGISLQALALVPALRTAGVRLQFRPDWSHPAVRRVFRLSGWTLGYAGANIAAALVIQNLAEPGSGDLSAYTLAFTFFLLPHALLAMSILTTFVPDLAGFVKRRDRTGFVERMSLGVRLVALVTVPAGFGLFVLRQPIIGGLMQHGSFDRTDTLVTSRALAGFALGLAGFSIYLFVLRGFYSHQDTRTAFVVNLFQNGLNVVLALLLVGRYGVLGLGAAFALSYAVAAVVALYVLRNKVGRFDVGSLLGDILLMSLAALVMAESIWFLNRAVGSNEGIGAWGRIVAGLAIGPLIYGSLLLALASPGLRRSLRTLRRS